MNLERLETLVGKENLDKIKNTNILIVGIGGVGGYALETLVRSGIENITIVDYDKIDSSNLNRQIIATIDNINNLKIDEAQKRYSKINPNLKLKTLNIFLDKETIKQLNICHYDYIVDACDTLTAKELLISAAIQNKIKIISSMGTAKKMDASKLSITTLDKTSYDPLAKNLRRLIDKKYQRKIKVVSSTEIPKKIEKLGSNSYVPAVAGLLITNYIINDIIKEV